MEAETAEESRVTTYVETSHRCFRALSADDKGREPKREHDAGGKNVGRCSVDRGAENVLSEVQQARGDPATRMPNWHSFLHTPTRIGFPVQSLRRF